MTNDEVTVRLGIGLPGPAVEPIRRGVTEEMQEELDSHEAWLSDTEDYEPDGRCYCGHPDCGAC